MMGDILVNRFIGKVHQLTDLGLNPILRAKRFERFRSPSASLEIFKRAAFTEPPAEGLNVSDQRFVAALFSDGHKVSEGPADQFLLSPALDRLESGNDFRLRRKRRQKRLSEAVDGLDFEATWTVEHPCKQLPRPLQRFGVDRCAKREQLLSQHLFGKSNPGGETGADSVRHFSRRGLGKGEAKDGLGTCALK